MLQWIADLHIERCLSLSPLSKQASKGMVWPSESTKKQTDATCLFPHYQVFLRDKLLQKKSVRKEKN